MTRQRMLIVDDDQAICRLVKRLLLREEVEVITACSTAEAQLVLDGGRVDLILCDHYMPGENGLPFLQRIKKERPDVTRVLLTGSDEASVGVDAINKAQVHCCIPKPFESQQLRETIRRLLCQRRGDVASHARGFTQRRLGAMKHLDFDHPGIAEVRRDTQGAILIEDDFESLCKTFEDWDVFDDSTEIKSHEQVKDEQFVKLLGS